MSERKVFARPASGLIREMPIVDAALFGLTTVFPLVWYIYLFPLLQAWLPGCDPALSYVLAFFIGAIAVNAGYAALGSMMPRSGGDYVFQSRLIHPSVGFAVAVAWMILWAPASAIGTTCVAEQGLSPLFTLLGYYYDNPGLIGLGAWVLTPDGLWTLCIIVNILTFVLTVVGMRWYVRIQRYILIPFMFLTTFIIIALLLMTSPLGFQQGLMRGALRRQVIPIYIKPF